MIVILHKDCMQRLGTLRCYVKSKFERSLSSDSGVKIAFKLPDGSKTEHIFSRHSIVKVYVTILVCQTVITVNESSSAPCYVCVVSCDPSPTPMQYSYC